MSPFVKTLVLSVLIGLLPANAIQAQSDAIPTNLPERNEAFMDWGLGMFVHWSMDSQLGSVISHSMVGASPEYLDRYLNELPKTFNPKHYDPTNGWRSPSSPASATWSSPPSTTAASACGTRQAPTSTS